MSDERFELRISQELKRQLYDAAQVEEQKLGRTVPLNEMAVLLIARQLRYRGPAMAPRQPPGRKPKIAKARPGR